MQQPGARAGLGAGEAQAGGEEPGRPARSQEYQGRPGISQGRPEAIQEYQDQGRPGGIQEYPGEPGGFQEYQELEYGWENLVEEL